MARHYGAKPPQGASWQMGKSAVTIQKIYVITNRLDEYIMHCNDAYVYNPEEIDAVRELKMHAAEDLEFLLTIIMDS